MNKKSKSEIKPLKWSFVFLFILIFAINSVGVVTAQDATPEPLPDEPDPQLPPLGVAAPLNDSAAEISYHPVTGKVSFIGSNFDLPISNPHFSSLSAAEDVAEMKQAGTPERAAKGFLGEYGALFGLNNPETDLLLVSETRPDERRSFVRFQQQYQGIPVFGGELVVQMDAAGNVISANGEILPDINLSTNPAVSSASADQAAMQVVVENYQVPPLDQVISNKGLWIYSPALVSSEDGKAKLVWRVEITTASISPIHEIVLVDAQSGEVALHFNQTGAAKILFTYNAGNGTSLPGTFVCDESDLSCASGDADAQAAHSYASDFYDFLDDYLGRDSLDDSGLPLRSTVNYGTAGSVPTTFEDGAYWNGSQAIFADAANTSGYSRADDIVGHEFAHGFIDYTAGLFNYNQSGAIAESLADMWGEFVDQTNGKGNDDLALLWHIGEDSPDGAFRNMIQPTDSGQPDMMTSSLYYTGTLDNGGIHTNSGVGNKAAAFLVDGGYFNNVSVTGIGLAKASAIYYEAQTNLLVSGSDYQDLYHILYQACMNILGNTDYDGNKITIGDCGFVRNATDAVEMNLQPTATPLLPFDADPDLCPEVNQQTYLFIDDLETDDSQWSYGIDTGSQHWGYKTIPTHGRDAHSGLGYLYADDTYNSSDSFVMTDPFNIPADVGNGAFLYYYHDLMLDSFSSDQGFVEYRIDGGAWTNTNTLSSLNGYNATTHYTGTSQGYIGTRVDLSTLAASNNVQIRWRLVTDSTGIDKGWYLDDVKVYTCSELNFVPAGKYDDNDLKAIGTTLINYTGSWSLTGDSAYYKSTQHSTVQNLATAVLGFYGTKVTVYYSKGTNRGSFKVYIDDVMLDTIEQAHFATETGWVWYSGYIDNDTNPNNELIAANHTIKLEFISAGAGTSGLIDAIEVEDLPEPAVVESGYYDDISKDITITGNWLRKDPVISAYKSTTHETTDPGARLKLTWFAKRPMLIYPLHPEAGKVDAYLDDVFYARINQKAPDFIAYQGYRWTISPSFDPPSEHTIEFRLAPGQSAGTKMFIDAIVVPAAVRRTAGVYDDHDLGFFFTGQWLAKGGPSSPYFMKARHQTSVGNSMMKNTITGNRVCLIYPGGPDRGQGRVDIDGGYYGSMNEYWPTVRFNMVWCTNELPLSTFGNDEHSVAFFYIAGQPSTLQLFIDGLMIFEKIVVTTNGWYDDRDSELVFTGYWMPSNDPVPGAYLGTIYETKKQNARAKFYFDDGKVTFQYQKGPQGGLVDIYIDGVYETTINQYSASTQQSNQWTMSTSLPAGEHYIELRLAAGQSNKSLYVDAFILGN